MFHFFARWLERPIVRWAMFLACLAAMLYGTFRPEPPPDLFAHSDKFGHVLGYAALVVTARMAIDRIPWQLFWAVCAILAVTLEYLQAATRPLRIFSLEDAWANLAGAAIALALVVAWQLAGKNLVRQNIRSVPERDRSKHH